MANALVLSAGGLFGAWQVGVWKALRERVSIQMIAGASAGAWNGWAIAGGATAEELAAQWLDPLTARLMQPGLHASGILKPDALYRKARELAERYRPRMSFGLAATEVPRLRAKLFRETEITWRHLAATVSIPLCFPPVCIGDKNYVDGGVMGALPLWAAEQMGAERAIAVNALTSPAFRVLHSIMRPLLPAGHRLEVTLIEPSQPLGSVRNAVVWSAENVERWIRMGEEDGNRVLESMTRCRPT